MKKAEREAIEVLNKLEDVYKSIFKSQSPNSLNQKKLAAKLGFTPMSVSRLVKPSNSSTSIRQLMVFMETLNVSKNDLIAILDELVENR